MNLIKTFRAMFIFGVFGAFFGLIAEVFTYPGFLANNLGVSSIALTLALLCLAFLQSFFFKYQESKSYLKTLIILCVLAFIATIVFSLLELLNYYNFVFTKFHISIQPLFQIAVSSFVLAIGSLTESQMRKRYTVILTGCSLILLLIGLAVPAWNRGAFNKLIDEDGIFETIQFVSYFVASLLFFFGAVREHKSKKLFKTLMLTGLGMAFFFIAGEEISWGQRIFSFNTPQSLVVINEQKEFNIHNLKGLNEHQRVFYMAISLLCSSLWIFLKRKNIVPRPHLIFFFFPIFIIYLLMIWFFDPINYWREFGEFMFALGVLLYAIEILIFEKLLVPMRPRRGKIT